MKVNMLNRQTCLCKHSASFAIAAVQMILLLIVIDYCMPARAQIDGVPAAAAQFLPFHLYADRNGVATENQVPDIAEEFTGVVTAVWNADTPQNRRVCQSRWLFKRATESFCARLARHKIVSVHTDAAAPNLVAYIAVSQTQRVAIAERVRIRRAVQNSGGAIVSMPALIATYPGTVADGGSLISR
jgi:hypothetical protein